MRTSTATNSFRSEAEVAEGRRPPQDRAEENFALLLQVIAGDSSVFVPWVKILRLIDHTICSDWHAFKEH
jgi:hypothetical protein